MRQVHGWAHWEGRAQLGMEAVVTEVEVARDAALMYAGGEMPNLSERLQRAPNISGDCSLSPLDRLTRCLRGHKIY
jgi:hypothetical protein